jgi:hypothetical protein
MSRSTWGGARRVNTRTKVQKQGIGNILRNVLVEIGSAVVDSADIAPGEV